MGVNPPAFVRRHGAGWRVFSDCRAKIRARQPSEVIAALIDADRWAADGFFVGGYVGYAAGSAFDTSLTGRADDGYLVALDVFAAAETWESLPDPGPVVLPSWQANLGEAEYGAVVEDIRGRIARGEVYQVNFTYRLHAEKLDPWGWFCVIAAADAPPFATYFWDGDRAIMSLSPERFYAAEGDRVVCQPMKGTAAPLGGREYLSQSVKDQAENLMITDMIRNDLGRIARVGSVRVPALFEITEYPTVTQMTSRIEAESDAGLARLMGALHPCASVTGAPKVAAMTAIAELETSPRGVYCGAIGTIEAGRQDWSVGIRTAVATPTDGGFRAEYGVGSGITWDSNPAEEWAECLQKTQVLRGVPWDLLETMPGDPAAWEWHLRRLAASAQELGVPIDLAAIRGELEPLVGAPGIRLTVNPVGFHIKIFDPIPLPNPLPIAFAPGRLRAGDPWRRHKTTRREVYDQALADFPAASEVLLGNDRGEWVEFCRGNLIYRIGDQWFTPPVDSGALPGIARACAIAEGWLDQRPLPMEEIPDEMQFVNSLRGRLSART
jgi:para-aminobenzoate synthetase/4-amino-4-deoxychorismate lyase